MNLFKVEKIENIYSQLSLKAKLFFPLLVVFLSMWIAGTLSFGYFFTQRLEEELVEETEQISALILQDFVQKKELLFLKARWIADNPKISDLVSQGNHRVLLPVLLPMQASFGLDFIKVIDKQGEVLVELKNANIGVAKLQDEAVSQAASIGMDLFDLVATEENQPSLLVGITSIKSTQEILGGVIVGMAINDEMLTQMRVGMNTHLVIFTNDQVSASTLVNGKNIAWQPPPLGSYPIKMTIGKENYLVKSLEIAGFNGVKAQLVLLNSLAPLEQTQYSYWLAVTGFCLLGGGITTVVGNKVTHLLANRIISLTKATQQLAEGDLNVRINLVGNDEVTILAQGFNYMAQQVEQLLVEQQKTNQKLATYSQGLEQEVQKRTQELHQKHESLQQTLQELQHTQAQMIQNEKMSSLGQMVAGVAHEINNPVSFVHGNLIHAREYIQDLMGLVKIYQEEYPQPSEIITEEIEAIELDFLKEDLPNLLNSMQMGTDRIKEIVKSLRTFSRLDEAEFKEANIHEGIDSTLMILDNRLKATSQRPEINVIKNYGNLPLVYCYAGQLNQVFMNLISNAIDALEEARLEGKKEQTDSIWINTFVMESNCIAIQICDNGMGMSQEVSSKLFDPFFTTKPVGKGTGLGLSISYQIITERHKGKLRCDSTPGEGTKFIIEIPAH